MLNNTVLLVNGLVQGSNKNDKNYFTEVYRYIWNLLG